MLSACTSSVLRSRRTAAATSGCGSSWFACGASGSFVGSCSLEWAISWIMAQSVCTSLMPSRIAMRCCLGEKKPSVLDGMGSIVMGTGAARLSASTNTSNCSTVPFRVFTSCGSSLPSVCDTSNTDTTRNTGICRSTSSSCALPLLSSSGALV